MELKEAIEELKDLHSDMCLPTPDHLNAIQFAISKLQLLEQVEDGNLREQILNALENNLECKDDDVIGCHINGKNLSADKILDLCNADFVRRVEGIEEVLFKTKLPYFPARPEYLSGGECEVLTQAITAHLTKGK